MNFNSLVLLKPIEHYYNLIPAVSVRLIQIYANLFVLNSFFSLLSPRPFFLFLLVNLFVGVEFWPGEPQHLSVGEGVGGSKCIFQVTASLCTHSTTSAVWMDTCEYSSLRGKRRYLIYGRAQPDFRKYLVM